MADKVLKNNPRALTSGSPGGNDTLPDITALAVGKLRILQEEQKPTAERHTPCGEPRTTELHVDAGKPTRHSADESCWEVKGTFKADACVPGTSWY